MSKITFRADDELVERVDRLDTSKSEVMREALRAYLDEHEPARDERGDEATLDELVAQRVDAMLAERLDAVGTGAQDLNLSISLEGVQGASVERGGRARPSDDRESDAEPSDAPADEASHDCGQCGTELAADHVYCPNCGEKATRRVFCDCGDEIRSDWAFCPSCGRRTPAADVLDGG